MRAHCVPGDVGIHSAGVCRMAYVGCTGTLECVRTLRDAIAMVMIERRQAVEQLEEILAVEGIDMIQWGSSDYSMSIGKAGGRNSPEVKAVERRGFETAREFGVPTRVEIASVGQAKCYLDLGVRHFALGNDLAILYDWWKANGNALRKVVADA